MQGTQIKSINAFTVWAPLIITTTIPALECVAEREINRLIEWLIDPDQNEIDEKLN